MREMLRLFIGTIASLALAGTAVSAKPGGDSNDHEKGHGGEAAHGDAASGETKVRGNDQSPSPSSGKAQKSADKGPPSAEASRHDKQAAQAGMQSPVRAEDRKTGKSDNPGKAGNAREHAASVARSAERSGVKEWGRSCQSRG